MKQELRNWLAQRNVRLVAISKKKPAEDILKLYTEGQRDFGENRVSELVEKQASLPEDIRWHMVGHLQSKKTKLIAPFIHMIQSVDSLSLCEKINREAGRNDRVINILLQIKIAREESKYGYGYSLLKEELPEITKLSHIRVCGVMGMATLTEDEDVVRGEFLQLANYFQEMKKNFFPDKDHFREISMGMSGDYRIAVDSGSTMVRIGSLIFGPRD